MSVSVINNKFQLFWSKILKAFEFAQINHTRAINKNVENYSRPTDWTIYTELNYRRCINGELGPENDIKAFQNSRHTLCVRRNEMLWPSKCVIACDSAHEFFSSHMVIWSLFGRKAFILLSFRIWFEFFFPYPWPMLWDNTMFQ